MRVTLRAVTLVVAAASSVVVVGGAALGLLQPAAEAGGVAVYAVQGGQLLAMLLRHVVKGEAFPWTLLQGAKGVQLAELGLKSWTERRWLDVPPLA